VKEQTRESPKTPQALSSDCVVCGTALSGAAGLLLKAAGVSRSPRNPNVCTRCNAHLEEGRIVELTVLFADLSGFTELTGALGAEETHRVVDGFLRMASEVIVNHGGFIDKYIGDAVMAFFNVPIRREDHAFRALQASLDLQSKMPIFSAAAGHALKCTVGIATGYARLGRLGSSLARDYTVIGEAVNLAARLQTKARPGEVLLDASAYSQVAEAFPDVEREELALKGFLATVGAYRFLEAGPKPAPEPAEKRTRRASIVSLGSLAFALLGAPCAAAAALGPLALLLGVGSAAGAAAGASGHHLGLDSAVIRLPLLSLATLGAVVNLAAAWHARRLRARAHARGEFAPPTRRERLRTRLAVSLSLASLAVVLAEMLAHKYLMHHPWP
jgi:adenylate cyclase